jgi:capsular exopolysaccharide synthesis family protein
MKGMWSRMMTRASVREPRFAGNACGDQAAVRTDQALEERNGGSRTGALNEKPAFGANGGGERPVLADGGDGLRNAFEANARLITEVREVSRWRSWLGAVRRFSQAGDGVPVLIVGQERFAGPSAQFQVLRSNLEAWAAETDKRIVLITSPLPGEGRSFVAANLAVALARAGSFALLVDADLKSPSLDRAFGVSLSPGLLDYLEGTASFEQCLRQTTTPRLALVPSGGRARFPSEVLAHARLRQLLEKAESLEPRPYVLIDSTALLGAAQAEILAKVVDATLLVVAANRTAQSAVSEALEILKEASKEVPMIGVALNRFEPPYSIVRNLRNRG